MKKKDVKDTKGCPISSGINRKDFLKFLGKGAVAAASFPALHSLTGCDGGGLEVVKLTRPAPPSGQATVGVVRKSSIKSAVQSAIEMAGGLSDINQGDTVLVKPNIVGVGFSGGPRPFTHPDIIETVLQEIKSRTGAGNITVCESSYTGPGSDGTSTNAQQSGILDVINSEGVKFVAWDEDPSIEYVVIECEDIQNIGYNVEIPKTLVDGTYDHYINLPMIKNHSWQNAGYTCCIKNFVATMRLSTRKGNWLTSSHDWINLGKGIAELNLSTPKITMNILDGLSVVLSGGPMSLSMTTKDTGLILASSDRVAADSLALAVLRYYASVTPGINEPYQDISIWEQPQISRALELNLGRREENIMINSDGVDEIDGILSEWS